MLLAVVFTLASSISVKFVSQDLNSIVIGSEVEWFPVFMVVTDRLVAVLHRVIFQILGIKWLFQQACVLLRYESNRYITYLV